MTVRDRRLRAALRTLAGRVEQAPMLIAAAKVPVSFQRTLMPRSTLDQGLVTGLSMTLDYTLGALVQDGIEVVALRLLRRPPLDQPDDFVWRRVTLGLDLTAMGIGVVAQVALRQRPGERLGRATARTTGYWLTTTGLAGAVVTVLQEALRTIDRSGSHDQGYRSLPIALPAAGVLAGLYELRRRVPARLADGRIPTPRLADARPHPQIPTSCVKSDDDGWRVSVLRSLALGAAVSVSLGGLAAAERAAAVGIGRRLGRLLPGRTRLWRPLGHAGALLVMRAGIVAAAREVTKRVETNAAAVEPPFHQAPRSPLVSGGPGSLVAFASLGRQGRRTVSTAVRREWIASVMGKPAVAAPIRVYVGVDSADDDHACVRLALAELERTGAFDRALLMVISPTGTGYVNHVAIESTEYLSLGDIASVTVQYAKRPSVLSLGRRSVGSRRVRMLLEAIHTRLCDDPPARRPCVVLFGESLGAWTSQDAFIGTGTDGLLAYGVDRALWIGTPFRSKWKQQVLYGGGRPAERALIGFFDDFSQVEALTSTERERLRYFMVTHHDDPVAHWSTDLLVQSPPWLDAVTRPPRVPATQRWVTPHTFVETFIDMKNASKVVPGVFEAKGHDYRGDLLRFVGEAYGLPADERQLTRIEAALRRYELLRKRWIDAADTARLDELLPGGPADI
jgi:uncharacterized membrane protein